MSANSRPAVCGNRVQISIFEGRLAFFHIIRKVFPDDAGQNPVSGIDLGDDLTILRYHLVETSDIGTHMIHGAVDQIRRRSVKQDLAAVDHQHPVADSLHIIHDMRGKEHDPVP